jgi:penicillin-insensitive murein DD-endopeptidase
MPEVDRIFVNAAIKKELCQSKSSHDWLQKIRPWYKHDDHFHVRLKCPTGDRFCEKQEPVPAGDGCGADLAWWFSYEAKHPTPKPPAPKIPLPNECNSVLYE